MKKCQFCELKSSNSKLFSDAKYFAFEDIDKASAKQHILVCTNKHIETPMDVESKDTLLEMREVGRKVLEGMCDQNDWKKEFRFGFHLPPFPDGEPCPPALLRVALRVDCARQDDFWEVSDFGGGCHQGAASADRQHVINHQILDI